MRSLRLVCVLSVTGLVACGESGDVENNHDDDTTAELDAGPDSDNDGLSDAREAEIGSDPALEDSDGDTLLDGAEYHEHGTNPLKADSDDDTYLDPWELAEGTDPTDASSVIYRGGWAYNPDKSESDAGPFGSATVGGAMPWFSGVDQHGDDFQLWDLTATGKPILIDISAVWCGPCNSMSNMLAGQESWGGGWDAFRAKINNGDAIWVTVLIQDLYGAEATGTTVADWDAKYPNELIVVMTDPGGKMNGTIRSSTIPSLSLIAPDGTWEIVNDTSGAANTVLRNY